MTGPVQYHTVLPRHAAARPDLARPNPLRNLNSSLDCYKIWKCWALADTRLQTPDHCKCPTQHQTESRSRCNLKNIILKQKQQEENKCPQQFVNVYNVLIRDSFLFLGQGVGPCHHQSPLPDQTKGINQVKLRISFDYAIVHH